MSRTCCFSFLMSPDCSVNFKGSSFSSDGKQLAKSCEAKSFDSSGFKEITTSSVSGLISRYKGLAFSEATYSPALAFFSSSSLSSKTMIGSSYGESGVKKADLVSFKRSNKSSSFIFFETSSALDSSFIPKLFLVPSSIPCYEGMESLGVDNLRSALAVESAEASHPDADLE
ncbi:hypothetical protein Tco_1552082 [Tanacetum coccineum]